MANRLPDSQRFRPLLPQPTPPVQASPIPRADLSAKSTRTRVACDACRFSKTKCSSERPTCKECIKRNTKCRYERFPTETRLQGLKRKVNELNSRKSPYEQLFELLKSAPEQDSREILSRLRQGTDVESLVSHATDGNLLLQLSVIPETRYRYEFPYISTMPVSLVTNDNPYLQSHIYEAAAMYASSGRSVIPSQSQPSLKTNSVQQAHKTYGTVYQKPFHVATVVEPRLSQVKVSYWTSVCQDDELMRNLLSVWFHCEYQFTAAVQKDLFLEDMAAQREEFCSSLLVNIMLGYACICYTQLETRARYWDPKTLTYRFLAEAKRLWELEAHRPRITTIQAGMLFNVFYNLSGLDEVGQAYRIQVLALAKSIRLFSSAPHGGQSRRIRHGMAYAAWALFNWETLVGFSFMFAPLLSEPPDWQLPDPLKNASWYGEIWVRYPISTHLIPLHFGQVFKARSSFRIIMNEACQTAYSKDSDISPQQANEFLSRLKDWFKSLPETLSPKSIALPDHLQLHMYYHHLILTIVKPLLDKGIDQDPSPQHVVDEASRYLQTLIRLYYLRHGFEAMNLFIVIPLTLAAYDCLDAINEHTSAFQLEQLRSTLILVAQGLNAQRKNHYLAEALFRVIRGRMRPVELSLFNSIANVDEGELGELPDMAQAVRSNWPITVVKDKKDVDSYILANLVNNYAHLNVEEETGSGDVGADR